MEIAVISGKGGTGKSNITAALASLNTKVVLADCDVDAANLYLIFNPAHEEEEAFVGSIKASINPDLCTGCGICSLYCRFNAIMEHKEVFRVLETDCDGCYLCARLCPEQAISMQINDKSRLYTGAFRFGQMVYGWLAPGEENSGKLVNRIREKARQLAQKDSIQHILLDGPPGIGCPVISTITGVDVVLVVTEPSLSAISDLKRTLKMISSFKIPHAVLVNKWDLNQDLTQKIEDYCNSLHIPFAGKIAFDTQMVEAMLHCQSIVEWNPSSETSNAIKTAWKLLQDLTV